MIHLKDEILYTSRDCECHSVLEFICRCNSVYDAYENGDQDATNGRDDDYERRFERHITLIRLRLQFRLQFTLIRYHACCNVDTIGSIYLLLFLLSICPPLHLSFHYRILVAQEKFARSLSLALPPLKPPPSSPSPPSEPSTKSTNFYRRRNKPRRRRHRQGERRGRTFCGERMECSDKR